jgi:hypothetical protein
VFCVFKVLWGWRFEVVCDLFCVFVFAICKFVEQCAFALFLSSSNIVCVSLLLVPHIYSLLLFTMFHGYLLAPSCLLSKVVFGKHEPPILSTFFICLFLSVPCCSLLLFVFGYVPPIFGAPHHSILCKCGRRNLNDYFKFFQAARQVCIFFLCLFVFVYLGFKKFISPT